LDVLGKKAKAGDAEAQYQLGEMYFEALKVKQDLSAAKEWIEKAAAQKNAKAVYRLASMRFTGVGFHADPIEGRKLFAQSLPGLKKLAESDDADAQGKLGVLYVMGLAAGQDFDKAVELFQKAAAAGNVKAQADLAGAYLAGKSRAINPTLAGEWFEKAAQAGYGPAQIQLGILCIKGRGRRQNIAAGIKWIETASRSSHPVSAKKASDILVRLEKSPPSPLQGINRLIERAKAGDLKSQTRLAKRHQTGDGVRMDLKEAAHWLRRAARQGDGESCYRLGGYLLLNQEGKRDASQAARLWRLACALGHSGAQADFAVMCAKGDGIPRSLKEAYHWMLIARRSLQTAQQKQRLDTLQDLLARELDPDLIFSGLGDARKFQAPDTAEARKNVAAAAFGDGKKQLTRGEILAKTFPVEALMWMRLAEKQNVKNASVAANELTETLSKEQLAEVEKRVKAFVPLANPH
jgi:TPR repeat protein